MESPKRSARPIKDEEGLSCCFLWISVNVMRTLKTSQLKLATRLFGGNVFEVLIVIREDDCGRRCLR